jgi:hypothetical protein
MKQLSVTQQEAAQLTSLSVSKIDIAIRAGEIPVRHHGNRTVILVRDLENWVESLPAGRCPAPPQLAGARTGRPRKNRIPAKKTKRTRAAA